jgi:hypothetical protein
METLPGSTRFPSRDRIKGEYVLSFYDASDQAAFMALARSRGVEILGQTRLGNSVRIRVADEDALRYLLERGPRPTDYGANYRARRPRPVEPTDPRAAESGYVAFGGASLPWLGVPRDNSDWGTGIGVAVLDSGIQAHDSLSGVTVSRLLLADMAASSSDIHGTAVASLIAGSGDELRGMAPGVSLLDVPVLDSEGSGNMFTVAIAIQEAVDKGCRVINVSLGSYGDSYLVESAVRYAAENGAVVVAASGNDAVRGVFYPAAYADVVAVAAVDGNGRHLYFSNRGEEVDISAPGIGVAAAGDDNSTSLFSGTSAAVPFVSGAIAALLSANPSMSARQAADILLANADDRGAPGVDEEYGSGILNMTRVQNRNVPGIIDAAVGDVWLDTTGDQTSVLLYIQNRGTETISSVDLNVSIDGVPMVASFYGVEPGDTVSRAYGLIDQNLETYGAIAVSCEAVVDGAEDQDPSNNSVSGTVRIGTPQ